VAWNPDSRWRIAFEGVYRKTAVASGHVGLEWRPITMIALRAGYRTDTLKELSPMAGLTTGIGVDLWGQELAYAWLPYGELGNTQYFSLVIRFGRTEQARRNLIHYQKIKRHRAARGNDSSPQRDPEFQQLMQLLSDQDREFFSRTPPTETDP
jgi:hypothetical protein